MRVPGKPHFRFRHHVWSCASWFGARRWWTFRIGYGYTVREAWDDWKGGRA